ncbi:hypothetical protein M3Y99_00449300 [Aphelenchoides fujianensis]|nr:hypothetical protein M3Y99_00449300 [Aphelenchoides fujianensis]
MPSCRHSAVLFLPSHEFLSMNVCTPFVPLPFRSNTSGRLEVAKVRNSASSVRIAIAGNAAGLRGALWFEDAFGIRTEERSFELNVPPLMAAAPQYPGPLMTECSWDQPFSPKHSKFSSSAHVRKLEEELKKTREQNETLKSEVADLGAAVVSLQRKCEEREKEAAREKAQNDELTRERALLKTEIDELKSKLHKEESRSSSLHAELHRRATAQKKAEQRAAHAPPPTMRKMPLISVVVLTS